VGRRAARARRRVDYACRRKAFGKPLIEHEGVGFKLARNEVDLRQTQLMIDYTAWTLDNGSRATTESSMAKLVCAETLYEIVDRSMQVMGGLGITDDTPVAQIFRDIRAVPDLRRPDRGAPVVAGAAVAAEFRQGAGVREVRLRAAPFSPRRARPRRASRARCAPPCRRCCAATGR
jgi:hypothetical protein